MSIISVRKENNKITIASDSQTTLGIMKFDNSQNGKSISKLEQFDDLIIGSVGYTKMIGLISLFLETNKLKVANEREVLRFFRAFETWAKKESDEKVEFNQNTFLLIFENKIFEFQNYCIREIFDFWAIGSGSCWALTALYLGSDVKKSVEVACEFDLYCGGKINELVVNF